MAALGRPGYINFGHNEDLPSKDVESMRAQAHEVPDDKHSYYRYIAAKTKLFKGTGFWSIFSSQICGNMLRNVYKFGQVLDQKNASDSVISHSSTSLKLSANS